MAENEKDDLKAKKLAALKLTMDKIDKVSEIFSDMVNMAMKIEDRTRKATSAGDLSVAEMRTLDAVGLRESKSMSQVAQYLNVSMGTLTTSISRLVKKGYVERFRIPEDRRVVKIRLTDSGEGFRPDVMAALYGGSKSSSDPRSGVGIGLPVVKRIAELHGGSLHIESSDQGSTATLSLSLQRASLSLRSMRFHTDPYGGRSAALVELSGVHPSEFYDPEEIEA